MNPINQNNHYPSDVQKEIILAFPITLKSSNMKIEQNVSFIDDRITHDLLWYSKLQGLPGFAQNIPNDQCHPSVTK